MIMPMDRILIFTDGSSRGNPGPGGWGAVIVAGNAAVGHVTERGGGEASTTNNRMELTAAAEALDAVPRGAVVRVYTDSSYLIHGITRWVAGWQRNGWKTSSQGDVLNKDLWVRLADAVAGRRIEWKHIAGHVGVRGNERCDEIATGFADGVDVELYDGPISGYSLPEIFDVSAQEILLDKKRTKNGKAYSYVSCIGGSVMVHSTWAECEKRVKGVAGARFKKARDASDEEAIKREFGRYVLGGLNGEEL